MKIGCYHEEGKGVHEDMWTIKNDEGFIVQGNINILIELKQDIKRIEKMIELDLKAKASAQG